MSGLVASDAAAALTVAQAVALGVADARLGQAVHLVVRVAPGVDEAEARVTLPKVLSRELPNFMAPRAIHWRQAMPIGPNGKIDRAGLALELIA